MTTEIHGFCDERFAPLREAFVANFDAGLELGASLALTYQEKMVVNLWAGFATPKRTRMWTENTIVQVASSTKILASIAILMLMDRGLLELDAPIARYWPAFAQGGKQADTVRDLLTHRTGAPGLNPPAPFEVVRDWSAITARIAAEPHWFGGQRRLCYHASTYGFLAGELIRRVDGRMPRQFCREEITERVGADFPIGVTEEADIARLATPQPPTRFPPPVDDPVPLRVRMSMGVATELRAGLDMQSPGGGGFSNGAGIAKVCAILANGGEVGGVRLLSARAAALASEEQCYEACPLFGPMRMGLGFALDTKEYPMPTPSFYHWGGAGGSVGLIDPLSRISLGYAPNNMQMNGREDGSHGAETRQARFIEALKVVLPRL